MAALCFGGRRADLGFGSRSGGREAGGCGGRIFLGTARYSYVLSGARVIRLRRLFVLSLHSPPPRHPTPLQPMLRTAALQLQSKRTMGVLAKLQDGATKLMFGSDAGTGECARDVNGVVLRASSRWGVGLHARSHLMN